MSATALDLFSAPLPSSVPANNTGIFSESPHLARIRSFATSEDPDKARGASVLMAIESTIAQENVDLSPAAYFGLLFTLLSQDEGSGADGKDTKPLEMQLQLLFIVLPHLREPLLLSKGSSLSAMLSSLMEWHKENLPVMKLIIRCSRTIIERLSSRRLPSKSPPMHLFRKLLTLCICDEAQISQKARNAVTEILRNTKLPEGNTSSIHKAAIEWLLESLLLANHLVKDQSNYEKTLVNIFESSEIISSYFTNSELYAGAGKAITSFIRGFGNFFQSIRKNNRLTYTMISILRKFLISFDVDYTDKAKCGWNAVLLKEIFLVLKEVRNVTENADVLANVSQALAQVVRFYSAVFVFFDREENAQFLEPELSHTVCSYPEIWLGVFDLLLSGIPLSQKWGASNDLVIKIYQSSSTIISDCPKGNLHRHSSDKVQDKAFDSICMYLKGYIHSQVWGFMLELMLALIKEFGPQKPLKVMSIVSETPMFRHLFISNSDELEAIRTRAESCIVTVINIIGWSRFCLTIRSNGEHKGSDDVDITTQTQLLNIYSRALSQCEQCMASSQQIKLSVHKFEDYMSEIFPKIVLISREMQNSGEISPGEKLRADVLRLKMWNIMSEICAVLPADISKHYSQINECIGPIISNFGSKPFFEDSPYGMDYIKSAYNAYMNILRAYVEFTPKLSQSDRSSISDEYKVILEDVNSYFPALCNDFISISIIERDSVKSSSKSTIIQRINETRNGLLSRVIYTCARVLETEKILNYILLILKTILSLGLNSSRVSLQDLNVFKLYLMLDLVHTLLSVLSTKNQNFEDSADSEIYNLAFTVMTKHIYSREPLIQKKSYVVLCDIVRHVRDLNFKDFLQKLMSDELLDVINNSSRRNRVLLLSKTICLIPADDNALLLEICTKCIPEIIIATKEGGSKTRKEAYSNLLTVVKHVVLGRNSDTGFLREEQMERPEEQRLKAIMYIVLAGLSSSLRMQAATIVSLAYLIHEFKDYIEDSFLKELFFTVSEFRKSDSKEHLKAYLVFIRIIISSISQERLDSFLEDIVCGLLCVLRKEKHRLRYMAAHILEKSARAFSYDAVEGFIPSQDRRIFAKIKKRKAKVDLSEGNAAGEPKMSVRSMLTIKKEALTNRSITTKTRGVATARSDRTKKRKTSKRNEDESSSTIDTFDEAMNNSRRSFSGVIDREDGDVADLLDIGFSGWGHERESMCTSTRKGNKKTSFFEKDSAGRLIIRDLDSGSRKSTGNSAEMMYESSDIDDIDMQSEAHKMVSEGKRVSYHSDAGRSSRKKFKIKKEVALGCRDKTWGYHQKKSTQAKMATNRVKINRMLGKKYKNKKGKGDVRNKGDSLEPYAYIPLSSNVIKNLKTTLKSKFK